MAPPATDALGGCASERPASGDGCHLWQVHKEQEVPTARHLPRLHCSARAVQGGRQSPPRSLRLSPPVAMGLSCCTRAPPAGAPPARPPPTARPPLPCRAGRCGSSRRRSSRFCTGTTCSRRGWVASPRTRRRTRVPLVALPPSRRRVHDMSAICTRRRRGALDGRRAARLWRDRKVHRRVPQARPAGDRCAAPGRRGRVLARRGRTHRVATRGRLFSDVVDVRSPDERLRTNIIIKVSECKVRTGDGRTAAARVRAAVLCPE